jgi:hypothetical protein
MPERITSAALRSPSGEIVTGTSHFFALLNIPSASGWSSDPATWEDGFCTDQGRFVSREEAGRIAGIEGPAESEQFPFFT